MSNKGPAGKKQWQEDRTAFEEELRQEIDQVSAERLQGWKSKGRFPLWIRIKWLFQRNGTR
jgi:hypothetical protein